MGTRRFQHGCQIAEENLDRHLRTKRELRWLLTVLTVFKTEEG